MGTGMGWTFRALCRWEVGGTSGMVTDDLETFRLDNLESEVVVAVCRAADRDDIYKNGSNNNLYRDTLLDCVSVEYEARRRKMTIDAFCIKDFLRVIPLYQIMQPTSHTNQCITLVFTVTLLLHVSALYVIYRDALIVLQDVPKDWYIL
jgi:hypothetical protein